MTAQAILKSEADSESIVAAAAIASGEVIQLADGRAGVYEGLNAAASGDTISVRTKGRFTCLKTASINLLKGGRAFWGRSANKVNYKPASGDFFMGTVAEDALAAASNVVIDLNVLPNYDLVFDGNANGECLWAQEATDGEGVTEATLAIPTKLSFDVVAEVAQAALFPSQAKNHTPIADGGIFEFEVAIYDIGDNALLDINFGVANESHGTDADSITESVFFHADGADSPIAILAESDDGTTEVNATDTTVVAVDDTFQEFWIDARDPSDIQLYIDGVNVLPASVFKLDAATGPIFPIVHLEKESNDVAADVRVKRITVRTSDN